MGALGSEKSGLHAGGCEARRSEAQLRDDPMTSIPRGLDTDCIRTIPGRFDPLEANASFRLAPDKAESAVHMGLGANNPHWHAARTAGMRSVQDENVWAGGFVSKPVSPADSATTSSQLSMLLPAMASLHPQVGPGAVDAQSASSSLSEGVSSEVDRTVSAAALLMLQESPGAGHLDVPAPLPFRHHKTPPPSPMKAGVGRIASAFYAPYDRNISRSAMALHSCTPCCKPGGSLKRPRVQALAPVHDTKRGPFSSPREQGTRPCLTTASNGASDTATRASSSVTNDAAAPRLWLTAPQSPLHAAEARPLLLRTPSPTAGLSRPTMSSRGSSTATVLLLGEVDPAQGGEAESCAAVKAEPRGEGGVRGNDEAHAGEHAAEAAEAAEAALTISAEAMAPLDADDAAQHSNMRVRYRCKRCGAPKRGHICSAQRSRQDGCVGQRKEWTGEEDRIIIESVTKLGGKWRHIAHMLPGRSDDAVRNRWSRLREQVHPLEPAAVAKPPASARRSRSASAERDDAAHESEGRKCDGKTPRLGWTPAEDAIIEASVNDLGHRWLLIAARLPGRTDHAIRNRWFRLQSMRQDAPPPPHLSP